MKTISDVDRYIVKSPRVSSHEELLVHLPPNEDEWNPNITWLDYPPHHGYPPGLVPVEPSLSNGEAGNKDIFGTSILTSSANTSLDAGPSAAPTFSEGRRSTSSQKPESWKDCSHRVSIDSLESCQVDPVTPDCDRQGQNPSFRWQDFIHGTESGEDFGPFDLPEGPQPSMPQVQNSNAFGDWATGQDNTKQYWSLAPEERMGRPKWDVTSDDDCLNIEVEKMLGAQSVHRCFHGADYALQFLRPSCQACIHAGRHQNQKTDSIAAAKQQQGVMSAAGFFSKHIGFVQHNCLAILNSMKWLLNAYGQISVAQSIFGAIGSSSTMNTVPSNLRAILADTISFLSSIEIPETGSLPCYDLKALRNCVELASKLPPPSQLLLSAKYNLAWALLEMGRNEEASKILISIAPEFKKTYGSHQLQTVVCAATLARSYLYINREDCAEQKIRDLVEFRINDMFPTSHALYWDFKCRVACFMKFRAAHMEEEDSVQHRAEAANLMRSVLEWRLQNLGAMNFQSQRTLKVLKNLYIEAQRDEDARDLAIEYPETQPTIPT